MITTAIHSLINKENLTYETAKAVMNEIMDGAATNAQISAYLTALRMKGESIDEISASAAAMRGHGTRLNGGTDVLDIVGTGGDEAGTFNISTISAIVVSAAGMPVAKHGNRSVSSKCGSADLLEALGVKLDLPPEQSARILKEIGLCFLFAPVYHASMKYAAPVRRELGIRTIFNILGPLANPAGATTYLLGVYDEELVEPMAKVLMKLGARRAMVVHSHDGLDEISLHDVTTVCEVNGETLNRFVFDPAQYGFSYCTSQDLVGGTPQENAEIALDVLSGTPGPKRDVVLLNSAVCLHMSDKNLPLEECVKLAAETIDSSKAMEQLKKFIRLSQEAAE